MNNKDHSFSDEEQLPSVPTDYGTLLAMTRPLITAGPTPLLLRGEEISQSGLGISPEPVDQRKESILRRGEIVRADESESGTTQDEGVATGKEEGGKGFPPKVEDRAAEAKSDSPETDSNLRMRIHLGMS